MMYKNVESPIGGGPDWYATEDRISSATRDFQILSNDAGEDRNTDGGRTLTGSITSSARKRLPHFQVLRVLPEVPKSGQRFRQLQRAR